MLFFVGEIKELSSTCIKNRHLQPNCTYISVENLHDFCEVNFFMLSCFLHLKCQVL